MRIFLFIFFLGFFRIAEAQSLRTAAEQSERYLPLLEGKRVGLVVNHTAMVKDKHLLDVLLAQKVNVIKVFAPEHGFRGDADAGAKIQTGIDPQSGLPVVSLYGKSYKPTKEQLADLDIVIFDIQDVGVRFYTYISTMHYVMEACAENGKTFLLLDRPNPNGHYVDGFVLENEQKSFVGLHPIPIVHGLTVGELAQMINGEGWLSMSLKADLKVIPCENYTHKTPYSLPIKPSPNLPNDRSIALYPSICLFEGTNVSLGRGTDAPFQQIGSPFYPDRTYSFTPRSTAGAKNPIFKDTLCYGMDFRTSNPWKYPFSLQALIDFYQKTPDKSRFFKSYIYRLAGTKKLREMIEAGKNEEEIRATWQADLLAYKQLRKKYLLYPDFE
jgi:uncharacterized protein YbbC (DUF1343 family)